MVLQQKLYFVEPIHIVLSILFYCFNSHGFLTSEFMKTAIVMIIKNIIKNVIIIYLHCVYAVLMAADVTKAPNMTVNFNILLS